MKNYFSMTSTNVKYFEECSVWAHHRAPPKHKTMSTTEMNIMGGQCTPVSSTMMGVAGHGGSNSSGVRHDGNDQEAELVMVASCTV
jgi:hypothetical protein